MANSSELYQRMNEKMKQRDAASSDHDLSRYNDLAADVRDLEADYEQALRDEGRG